MSSYYRNLSPGRGRHAMVDPMRASTGMVELSSSYDPYDAPRRYDYEDYPSDTGYASAYGYRSGRSSKLEVQPVSSRRIRDPSTSAKKRTEYTVQPRTRHRSSTTSAADPYETPVHLAVPSTSRHRLSPVHYSTHRRDTSPLPASSGPQLLSSSPRHPAHRRLYSNDYASDTGHFDSRDEARHRTGHSSPSHRVHPPTRSARYPAYDGLRKGDDIDDFDAYSYTNAREQFDRDFPHKPRPRGPRSSMGRPLSITGGDDYHHSTARKDRPHGPPPTSWGLDKLSRERTRASMRSNDDPRDPHRSRDGLHDQALVPRPQDSDSEYTSRHDHDERRRRRAHRARHGDDREHHYPEDRHHKPYDESALAAMGLGTAALGGGYSDMSDYEHYRPSRHKHRHSHGQHDAVQPPTRELVEAAPSAERNKQTYLDPADAHRHRRSRRRSRRRTHSDDADTSDDDLRNYRREPARRKHSSTDTESDRDRSRERSRHHRRDRDRDHSRGHHSSRSHRMLEDGYTTESRRSPPVDMAKDDSRRPVAVDPPTSPPKELETPPKGILKAPREAFPEEPNPVREGVAPLKDAHKQGIPPGARWTKIDRRLVNPEALEAGNERFEERSDYVIVLRVLSKEEIQKYAVKTQEIRDIRHKEQLRERRKSRDEAQRHGRRGSESSSDDEDEGDDEAPKQLEAPSAPKTTLPSRPRASSNSMHEAEKPRMMAPSATAV
ncbi:hypothetical protein N7475_007969 [Penicillium sp. IBT 31633x]|nr:hypothetical protein N7475_007969 [Penicillium sp. IBT 31633x]